ncbi:MAG: ABC transporter substrate-binding protein [Bacillota bacterium]|nr:ABC transporter substrate-binding protein [Bacillota bacterium]
MNRKTKHMTVLLMALLALVLAVGLTGCGGSGDSGSDDTAIDGNTLVYGSGDYTAINPALFEHGEINLLLFAGLTSHNENDEVVPGLAEEWKFDEDSNTYHFTLREGLTFHDGEPLTAEDVKFTIEAIQNPDNASENASNFEDVKAVNVIDDIHVDIVLTAPNEAMPDYLSIGVLPKHILDGQDITKSDFNQNPVGAGPYKLVSWDMGQSIVMEPFDAYYQGAPKIGKVIFKIVEDYDARALQLESGELNFAQITPKAESKFKDKEGFEVYEMTTADYRGIMYNFNNPLFKEHRELPAALSYAIDRQAIIDSVLLGHGQVACSPLQKNVYNEEDVEKYEYDPAKATAALEEAGWTKGEDGIYEKDGTKLEFVINCMQGDQVRIDMANLCAQYLGEIGAKVTVETPAEIDWDNQTAFLIGWGSPFDADDHTYKVFGTEQASNYSAYSNEDVDKALKAARETSDTAQRKALYSNFQKAMANDPAYTFIAYVNAIYAGTANIHGVTPDTILGHHGVGIFWNIHEWTID